MPNRAKSQARTRAGKFAPETHNRVQLSHEARKIHGRRQSPDAEVAPSKRFTRTIEDFECAHCGMSVAGNGFTNHCPGCLWSKHVDNNPGDRSSECGGLMRPIGAIIQGGGDQIVIIQRCESCGITKRNRVAKADDMDVIIAVSSIPAIF